MIEQNATFTPDSIAEGIGGQLTESVSKNFQEEKDTELPLESRIDATASDLAQKVLAAQKAKEEKFKANRNLDLLRESAIFMTPELAARLQATTTEAAIFKTFEITILEQHADKLTQMAQEQGITEESVEGMGIWEKTEKLQFKRAQAAAEAALKDFYLEAAKSNQPQEFLEQGEETMSILRGLAKEGASVVTIRNKVLDYMK